MHRIFDTRNFLKHWRDAHDIFRHCETKRFWTEKYDMFPFFNHKNFSKPEKFPKTVGFLYRNFWQCETNNLWRKIVTPLFCIKFFDTRKFLKHLKRAHEKFPHCETENFWRKYVIASSIMHKLFRLHQTFWNIEGMPTKFVGTVRPKIFDRKRDTPYYTLKIPIPHFF